MTHFVRRSLAGILVVASGLAGVVAHALPAAAAACITIDIASSPEKLVLLTDLGKRFARSSAADVGGRCVSVRVTKASSGAAATLLAAGWPKPAKNGPRPVIWSPAASTWGAVLDQRRSEAGAAPYVSTPGTSFMLTPLVIGMP